MPRSDIPLVRVYTRYPDGATGCVHTLYEVWPKQFGPAHFRIGRMIYRTVAVGCEMDPIHGSILVINAVVEGRL